MKNKLAWGGKNNTRTLRMLQEQAPGDTGTYGTQSGTGFGQTQTTQTYVPTGENLADLEINLVAVTPGVVQANTGVTITWLLTADSAAEAETLQEQAAEEQQDSDFGGS